MNSLIRAESLALWLADYYLLASVMLGAALASSQFLMQPVQRLAVTKATVVALFLLVMLCAIPGWSLVHLFTAEQSRANDSQAAPLEPRAIADLPTIPAANPNDIEPLVFSPPSAQLNELPSAPQPATNWHDLPGAQIAVAAHGTGTVCVFAWLLLGAIAAHRLQRSAQPAHCDLISLLTEVATPQNNSSRLPDLKISNRVDVAVALGIFRPTVLLPTNWLKSHAPDQLRTVLAHELAHVANHDLRWLAASRALMMLLWAQPLLWLVRRRMRLDQEALADAAAAELTSRQHYAEQLVAWAQHMPARPAMHLSAAVGLWEGPSQLRQRIALLLNERFTVLRNCSCGWRRSAIVASLAATLVLSLVTLEPNRQADAEVSAAEKANPSTSLTDQARDTTSNQTESSAEETTFSGSATISTPFGELRPVPGALANSIVGRCVDENGKPLAGLKVVLLYLGQRGDALEVKGEAITDASGEYRFENVVDIRTAFPNGKLPVVPTNNELFYQVVIRSPGRITTMQLASTFDLARNGCSWEHIIRPAATMRGRITGPDGEPVIGALVAVGLTMHQRLEGAQSTRTDADGRYEINDVAPFDAEKFRTEQEEQRWRNAAAQTANGPFLSVVTSPPVLSVEHPNFARMKTPFERIPGTKDVQLEAAAAIEGRVVFGDTALPAANVRVQAQTRLPETSLPPPSLLYRAYTVFAQTDGEGKFRFTKLPAGTYDFFPLAEGWLHPGVENIQTQANQLTRLPEIALTRGGIVRIRLVSATDGKPVAVDPDDEATISTLRVGSRRSVPTPPQTVKPQSDGTFEIRALPGQNMVLFRVVTSPNQVKWVASEASPRNLIVDVADNATVSFDLPVIDAKSAPSSRTFRGRPNALPTATSGNNLNAGDSNARVAVANRLVIDRKYQEALPILSGILREEPNHVEALLARAEVWHQLGEYSKVVADYETLHKLNPPFPRNLVAFNNFAYLLATCPDDSIRDGKRAVDVAERAKHLQTPPSAEVLDTLAAAYAEAGDFDKAISTQQEAIKLEPDRDRFRQHLQLYQAGKPLRDQRPEQSSNTNDDQPAANNDAAADVVGAFVAGELDRIAIDDRFMLCRVTTDLQRSLLGDAAEPAADASLCVFVNYAAFADEPLDSGSRSFTALSDHLKRLSQNDNRYVLMKVMVAEVSIGSDFEKVRERAQALAKVCEDLGRAAGYRRAKCSTSYGGDDWKTFIERASPATRVTDAMDESSVGDEQVHVFPVRTSLSRLLVKADCVVNIIPVVRHKQGTRFPDDFVPAMMMFVPQLEYDRQQTLLIRVRYADSANQRLKEWVNDRAGRNNLAGLFRFETTNLQQSFTNEPEKAADAGATAGLAATKPVEIPIIVAKHVLIHDGKIIEWADLEKLIAALPNPTLAHPVFKFTVEGGTARQEDIRAKIWELRRRVQMNGHTWSSVSPQMSPRYDAIRTAADLVPNESLRVDGTVETADGLPIDDAEVFVLKSYGPPSSRIQVLLQNERLNKLQDEIVIRSDASGRFAVYPPPDIPYYLVALHREGFGLVRSDEFSKTRRIAIQPWAHVKGRIKSDEPTDQSAAATMFVPGEAHSTKFNWPTIEFHQLAADVGPPPDRLFEIAFVPPLPKGWLCSLAMGEQGSIQLNRHQEKELQLSPGETVNIDIERPSDAEAARLQERLGGFRGMQERFGGVGGGFGFPGAERVREVAPNELVGRVVDTNGKPLAGVQVDVWTWHSGNETITDNDGRFILKGFDEKEIIEVQFTKLNYCPALFVAQQLGDPNFTVTLANDTYLEGRVLGPAGQPLPNAQIRASRGPFENPQGTIGEVWTTTHTDGEGRYRFYLEPDKYDIQVRVPAVGLARLENTIVAKGDQREFDIQLRSGPTFRALVLDAETNEPVLGIRLWNWRQPDIEGVSDANGAVTIENMTPGEFEFDVTAVGEPRGSDVAGQYAHWWSPDAMRDFERKNEIDNDNFQRNFDNLTYNILGNTEPIRIFVEKAVSIRGRVINPDGQPVAGATVAPAKTGSGNSITGDTRYSIRTAADGTFHIRLPASNNSKYNLVAHDGDYRQWRDWANGVGDVLQTRPGQELADVELRLTQPGVVRGKVVDADGKPVAKHRVRTHAADNLENRYYDPETRTDENGEFELKFVRPGDHYVQADPFWLVENEAESEVSRRITVKPGETVDGVELIHRTAEPRPPIDHILPSVPIPILRQPR